MSGVDISARNELFTHTSNKAFYAYNISLTGVEPMPDNIRLHNNTYYSTSNTGSARFLQFGFTTPATNVSLKNNLGYAPLGATADLVNGTPGAGFSESNNSNDTGGVVPTFHTNPSFMTPLNVPVGFRVPISSFATTGGAVAFPAQASDFLRCYDGKGNNRMGAFVPQTFAICRGATGP